MRLAHVRIGGKEYVFSAEDASRMCDRHYAGTYTHYYRPETMVQIRSCVGPWAFPITAHTEFYYLPYSEPIWVNHAHVETMSFFEEEVKDPKDHDFGIKAI